MTATTKVVVPDRSVGGRSFVLCPWTTVRGNSATVTSIVQDSDGWVDVEKYNDATFIIDCAEVTNPTGAVNGYVLLYIESSVTPDESGFRPILGPIPLTATAPSSPLVITTASASATPLARFVRWRIVPTGPASNFDATFRIRASGNRSFYFAPTMLGGVAFWVRADRGLTFTNQTVTGWADQSGVGDPNRNLVAGSSAPTLTLADTHFGAQPSVSFSGNVNCYFTTGVWSTSLSQSNTWVVVGMLASASANYFIDGNTTAAGVGQAIWVTTVGANLINASAGTSQSETGSWASAAAFMCEFVAGAGSNLYALNSFSTIGLSASLGSNGVNALSLGSKNVALGASNTWNGPIVEVIAFNGLLSTQSKRLLRTYLNNRYAMSIT